MKRLLLTIALTISPILAQEADWNGDCELNIIDIVEIVGCVLDDCWMPPPECNDIFGTVTDIDGNIYNTVIIGNQEWMVENLKTTHYRNLDEIPTGFSNSEWFNLSSGAYSVYENIESNAYIYGYLQNGYAVSDGRNIAPEGWHVPNEEDWYELVDFLGGSAIAGEKLKEEGTEHWFPPNIATNESGFTALPGGYRSFYNNGNYSEIGISCYFWSSSQFDNDHKWNRFLGQNVDICLQCYANNKNGLSVRCIKD